MTRERLLVIGPLPPPAHGVTISTSLVLRNSLLRRHFAVEHLNTSDHRSAGNLGTWDRTNLLLGLRHVVALGRKLRGRRGTVYLPLSQSAAALSRDLIFINMAQLARWRVAVHLRGGEFQSFYREQNPLFRAWIRSSLHRLDGVAVMGTALRSLFDGLVPADRISVVANGTPDFSGSNDRDGACVLFLGNLRRRKGVVEAVEAARIVAASDSRVRFKFVGEWEDAALERALRRRADPFRDRIQFLPPVSGKEKDSVLGSSSLLLFPPIEPEGHPRVVLEALAAGLPVVTTDRGAISETVTDGVSGFVLPASDPVNLAKRVLLLLHDDELRKRMAIAAREDYLARFTQEAADRRLAEWLSEVAGRAAPREVPVGPEDEIAPC
jgi:glycosyltransferase involved in cell wall biosynthesis